MNEKIITNGISDNLSLYLKLSVIEKDSLIKYFR